MVGDGGLVTHTWLPGLALSSALEGDELGQLPQPGQMLHLTPLSSEFCLLCNIASQSFVTVAKSSAQR